jgi:hypothetical protein
MQGHGLLTRHPASVGETYWQHLRCAWGFALQMLLGAMACLIHGLLPFLFQHTASDQVRQLHERMILSRAKARHDIRAAGSASQRSRRSNPV